MKSTPLSAGFSCFSTSDQKCFSCPIFLVQNLNKKSFFFAQILTATAFQYHQQHTLFILQALMMEFRSNENHAK